MTRGAFLRVWLAGVAGVAVGLAPMAAQSQGALPGAVKVGVVVPLSGPLAATGDKMKRGGDLFIKRLNAAGGIAGTMKIDLVYGDDKGQPAEGANVVQRLLTRDRVEFVIGSFASSVSLAMQPIVARTNKMFMTFSYANALTEQGFRNTLRVGPFAGTEMAPLARYAIEVRNQKTFSIVAQNSDFGRSMVAEFKRVATRLDPNVRFVSEDYYPFGATEFTPILTKIKGLNPGGILAITIEPEAIQFTKQYRELGLASQIYGSDLYAGLDYFRAVGSKAADGILFTDYWWRQPNTGPDAVRKFYEEYKAESGGYPDSLAVWVYSSLMVYQQAVEATKTTDQAKLLDYVLGGAKLNSLFGPYSFAPCGQAKVQNGVATWRGGVHTYLRTPGWADKLASYCPPK